MRRFLRASVLVIAACLVAMPLAGQGRGKGHGHGRGQGRAAVAQDQARIINDYFAHTTNLPPGLAKREQLPPGLARQLQRNGTLPPGLARRGTRLPDELERRLPRLPTGQHRILVGDRVVVVNDRTQRILDVFGVTLPR